MDFVSHGHGVHKPFDFPMINHHLVADDGALWMGHLEHARLALELERLLHLGERAAQEHGDERAFAHPHSVAAAERLAS